MRASSLNTPEPNLPVAEAVQHSEIEALRKLAFDLNPVSQHRLAFFIAENIGMVLVNEPEHPDSPHATPIPDPSAGERMREALDKINDVRNSIIGTQSLNWSEHVYPLVAALEAAGFEGMGYPAARQYYGTLVERAVKAEEALTALSLQGPSGKTGGEG